MSKSLMTTGFISQSCKVEGDRSVADKVSESAGRVTFPSVAAGGGAATAAVIRVSGK